MTEFMRSGAVHDEELHLVLIKELSIFPPGSCVILKNGELAVVVKRGSVNSMEPVLRSVTNKNGVMYDSPRLREVGQHMGLFEIHDVCSYERLPDVDLSALWAYR
ncbi:MAG: hypothetical protein GY807_04360 [Gammaproteobacteria bacterium]|nr:hypothetical protein [Gammaproteobacteria bacterium]